MKIVIASVLLLVATCVQAKEACDVELQGGLRITNTALEFTDGDKLQYKILKDQALWVNERAVSLDPAQQLLVKRYAASIRALVPEVRQLTLEGVDLASDAVTLVFQELLEPDNQTAKKVHQEFLLLRGDIEKSFASGKPININQKGIDNKDFFGMNFDARISNILEASGKEISWNLIKSVGSAIFSGDDKKGDFETRMNKFGETMEREMKSRAEALDKRGDAVCRSVALLDAKEEELKQSVKELNQFNFIIIKISETAKL